jgi:hypothetical protein
MGWGVENDPAADFNYLKSAYTKSDAKGTLDPWAVYFLKECYLRGNGTLVDTEMATRPDTWLRITPGRNVYAVIGADAKAMSPDEVRKRYRDGRPRASLIQSPECRTRRPPG